MLSYTAYTRTLDRTVPLNVPGEETRTTTRRKYYKLLEVFEEEGGKTKYFVK